MLRYGIQCPKLHTPAKAVYFNLTLLGLTPIKERRHIYTSKPDTLPCVGKGELNVILLIGILLLSHEAGFATVRVWYSTIMR